MHIVEMMEEIERLFEVLQTDGFVQLILAQKLRQVIQTLLVNRQFLRRKGVQTRGVRREGEWMDKRTRGRKRETSRHRSSERKRERERERERERLVTTNHSRSANQDYLVKSADFEEKIDGASGEARLVPRQDRTQPGKLVRQGSRE